jgi:hypothetical protein
MVLGVLKGGDINERSGNVTATDRILENEIARLLHKEKAAGLYPLYRINRGSSSASAGAGRNGAD